MPLAAGLAPYILALTATFVDTDNAAADAASGIGDASQTWAQTGVPMTMDIGAPPKGLAGGQTVAGFVTTTPGVVTGDGNGGIDSSAPGPGLSSVKAVLVADLTTVFGNPNNTAADAADGFGNAVLDFFSKAQILTAITGTMPPGAAVPAPVGPVGPFAYTASGTGGIDSASPGPGLASALSDFKSDLEAAFTPNDVEDGAGNPIPPKTAAETAEEIADAAETFFSSATISTVNAGTAGGGPATVVAPPAPTAGAGVTGPVGSPIISGASTIGTIA